MIHPADVDPSNDGSTVTRSIELVTDAAALCEQIKTLHAFMVPVHRIASEVKLPVRVVERCISSGELVLPTIQRSLFDDQPQRDAISSR